ARGWNSLVASAGGRLVSKLEAGDSRHIALPLASKNPLAIWRNAGKLAEIIRVWNVDIVHARSRAPAWSAFVATRRTGIPFVVTYHGAYTQTNAAKALYNSVMARGDTVIANSRWTADLIVERYPWANDNIIAIPRGTDFDEFDPAAVSAERMEKLLRAWGVEKDKPNFLFVHLARLTGWKGQAVVIDAAAQLASNHPEAVFVLAGDAQGREDYLDGLNSQIISHGLHKRVLLPGHCDDPAAAMAVADAVVVASTEAEAFGRAAVEAGALEKPVIVTRIGAVGETVLATPDVDESRRTGWKVTPNDPSELACAMREVMALSEDERATVGKRARHRGLDQFSLQQMCEKTLAVYDKLLAHKQ
ncbi:MAG: glycosyltransferase, partial [Rhizobiaceae bacterium]